MMRILALFAIVLVLAGCGGGMSSPAGTTADNHQTLQDQDLDTPPAPPGTTVDDTADAPPPAPAWDPDSDVPPPPPPVWDGDDTPPPPPGL